MKFYILQYLDWFALFISNRWSNLGTFGYFSSFCYIHANWYQTGRSHNLTFWGTNEQRTDFYLLDKNERAKERENSLQPFLQETLIATQRSYFQKEILSTSACQNPKITMSRLLMITKGLFVRSLFSVSSIISVWGVVTVREDTNFWLLLNISGLLFVEAAFTFSRKRMGEWKW